MTGWVVAALVFFAVMFLIALGFARIDPFRTRELPREEDDQI